MERYLWMIWIMVMFVLSHTDQKTSNNLSRKVAEAVPGNLGNHRTRKYAHYICYAILAVLLYFAAKPSATSVVDVMLFIILFAFFDEKTKDPSKGRHFDKTDAYRNIAGGVIGTIIAFIVF